MVSVIMSTYNETEEMLNKAVSSILNQTYKDLEFIIVIDNPDNIAVVNRLAEFEKQDRRIHVLKNEKNMGLVFSLNKAIDYSSGEYIARMDADDYSYPERIEKELVFLISGGFDLVCSCLRFIDESGKTLNPLIPNFVHNFGIGNELPKKIITNGLYYGHATWVGRASLFKTLKYHDIRHAEDTDMILRIVNSGARIGIWQEVLYDYLCRQTSVTRTYPFLQHYSAMYLKNHRKHIDKAEKHILKVTHSPRFKKMEKNYLVASDYYSRAKENFHNGKLIIATFNYLKASLKSSYFFNLIKRKIKFRIIRIYDLSL